MQGQQSAATWVGDIMSQLKSQGQDIMFRLDGIENRMGSIIKDVADIKRDLIVTNEAFSRQQQRLEAAEERISTLEDMLSNTTTDLQDSLKQLKVLQQKTDDLENRGRRKNLVLMGLPEKAEGPNPLKFVQNMLSKWLNINTDSPIELERAHRILKPFPADGKPARPLLIRFLRFQDKEMVLRAAKKSQCLREGEAKLTFRQDLSAEVRRKRRESSEVIEILRGKGMFRGFAYPSRLRVLQGGSILFFDNPKDVKSFVTSLK
ncbi:hypothetical protein WMY93_021917 [Mugilogobius chulae]|uniref:L1 transposable element RRM domain-containing protein n=1 Tax=Mugilogobius chulae TaxID=88201 RepID=A0AAW0NGZ8_9GOBI